MSVLEKLIGPRSKYIKSLPYTYEARLPIIEGEEEYKSYISDTICGLTKYLEKNAINPEEVKIYEVFQNEEKVIHQNLYTTKEGDWLKLPEICHSFVEHYKGHIDENGCSFEDRDCKGTGP